MAPGRAPALVARITTRAVATLKLVEGPCDDALPLLATRPRLPVFRGDGSVNYACPRCFAVVCEGIAAGDLAGIAVRCSCGAIGRLPGTAYVGREAPPPLDETRPVGTPPTSAERGARHA